MAGVFILLKILAGCQLCVYYQTMIVGIDEVGRGCLAGPVCVAAVAIDDNLVDAIDSKKLTAKKRLQLALQIRQNAKIIGVGWASHDFIDKNGLTAALKKAAKQALVPFGILPELILLDGNHNYIDDVRVSTIVGGDAKVPLISAASIIAKVARDNLMQNYGQKYPQYGFEKHVGYGTSAHRLAIGQFGPSAIQRLSFGKLGAANVD
jgi:ribonuclease HII